MKKINVILFALFCSQISAQTKKSPTAQDWQKDLRFLQKTVHEDYPFLFVKTTEETFNAEVEKLYNRIPSLENHEIIVGLSRIIALFKYGHMAVGYNLEPFKFHFLPLNLYQFSDGIYVQGVHKDYKDALGARVLEINGLNIKEALEKIYPVVSAENFQFFKARGINMLGVMEVIHAQGITDKLRNSVEFTLEKDGKTFKREFKSLPAGEVVPSRYGYILQDENWLDARDQNTTPLYLDQLDKLYFLEYLPKEKAVFVRLSQIEDDPNERMESFYSRLFDFIEKEEVEKLIIDVRLNGGGNNFKNRSLVTKIIENKKINTVGSLFVIIGRRTFSACQNLVNELHNYTNTIFLGEPTSENINFYGDSRPVILPNSLLPVSLSFAWWQDKPAWQNEEWLAPAIPVDISFEEYSTNKDPVLNAALAFSDRDFKPNPMRFITDLFVRGDIEQLDKEVPKMVKDPRYDFFDFETEISKAGTHLVGSGRMPAIQAGIGVFSFVTRLFPNSANAWKNLAEAYLKAGDKEKAKDLLQKSIVLDTNGKFGEKAKTLLREIENSSKN
ncbi:S41 family peptidase [Flagellimonas meridianipacifica]|uniref:Peptidase S41-like protein n=1 Tax=Flagellimonas meridianipacifica TaxID=1080225 RepID=A0A2T0MJZ7_9FLAO|nr:S41 family peptidase [Allomuricauda pacifica]PRX57893.1 peptidase S41-like protein [Allomuricauda pacifica]